MPAALIAGLSMNIYKQYNRQQLDNQYNNRLHVPDFADYLEAWDKRSEMVAQKHSHLSDIKYGDHSRERLDIFPSRKPDSKVLLFIHGGYWQFFDKIKFHFIADAFCEHNITIVLINYPLAPNAGIDEMVDSCGKAVLWLQQNIDKYNGNARQLYIVGHSAGAHLASMLAVNEWANKITQSVKGICMISGLYNLKPIQLCYVNEVLQMQEIVADRNSPIAFFPALSCPLLVAIGAAETDEFKDQGRELYSNWKNKSASIELLELPALNHFSILDSMVDENALLHKALLEMMGV